jgi:predicted MFS family arabinose efflux permease
VAFTDNRWVILGVLFLVRTSMGYQFQSIGSISPWLIDDLGIGHAEVGTLIGLFMLPGALIALPGGLLSQRLGDRRACVSGLVLMILGGVLAAAGQSYALASVGRLSMGAGAVLLNLTVTKMAMDWFAGHQIVAAMGILLSSWPLGIALGLLTQPSLADAADWPAVLYATSGICAAALALVIGVYHAPRPAAQSPGPASPARFLVPARVIAYTTAAGLAWGVFNVGLVVYFSFAPDVLVARGTPAIEASTVVSTALWVSLLSVPLGGFIMQRIGATGLIIAGLTVGAGAALAAMPYLGAPLAISIVVGIGLAPAGAIFALPSTVLGAEHRAVGIGIFFTWYYLAMAAGPPIAGLGRDLTNSASVPLLIGGAMFAATPLCVAAFRLLQRDGTSPQPSV